MPTENSDLISKELFFEDRFGNIQKLGKIEELQQYENKTDERDDAVDALRYAVENTKGYTATFTFTITKEASIQMQKMLGVQRITRKRFIKMLMGCGIQRNDAQNLAKIVHYEYKRYSPILVQMVIEWIIKSIEKENGKQNLLEE